MDIILNRNRQKSALSFWMLIVVLCFMGVFYNGHLMARHLSEKSDKDVVLDLNRLRQGQAVTLEWNSLPVYIYRRTEAEIRLLATARHPSYRSIHNQHADKLFIERVAIRFGNRLANMLMLDHKALDRTLFRSKDKRFLVVFGISPENGCAFVYKKSVRLDVTSGLRTSALLDPCASRLYDLSGRAISPRKKTSARETSQYWNLMIPPYGITNKGIITIGIEKRKDLPSFRDLRAKINFRALSEDKMFEQGILYGNLDVVKEAVRKGVNLKRAMQTIQGTPLTLAIYMRHLAIAKYLLEKGVSPDPGMSKVNALCLAIHSAQPKAIELLGQYHARFHEKSYQDRGCLQTYIITAAQLDLPEKQMISIVKLLIKYGANAKIADDYGKTAADYAKLKRRPALEKLLRSQR